MNKKTRNIVIGIVLIAGSLFGMTRHVDTPWHYFGNGIFFGVGLCIIIFTFIAHRTKAK